MRSSRLTWLVVGFLSSVLCASGADPVLQIISPAKTVTLTAAEFAALPHIETKLADRAGEPERVYSGVAMKDLLLQAGAPLGDKLRGPAQTTAVIVHCKDNYNVLFALAEFDENFSSRTILLADKENGEILPPSAAPFRVVTPGDKRGARSARQVLSIEIVPMAKP
jgi:hypothetical protein